MIALDWRNRPYPEPKPIDVSAAACQARAERHDRHWRIGKWLFVTAAWMVGAWICSWMDLSRTESMLVVVVLLCGRILHVVERPAAVRPSA